MTNLNLFMPNNFKETDLGSTFCKESIRQIKKLILGSITFTVVGLPAMGISIFLRYLVTTKMALFIHVDLYELPSLNRVELYKLLLKQLGGKPRKVDSEELLNSCKNKLQAITQKNSRVVIVFNRFDQLKKEFDQSFFSNLRALRDVDKEKIVMVFSANLPLIEQGAERISSGNLNMYSKTFYLKPFSEVDLKKLLRVNAPGLKVDKSNSKKALFLSGGHYQLLQLLLKSDHLTQNPLQDKAVGMQIKALYEYLNYSRRKQLQKIALGEPVKEIDTYLLDIGFIKKDKEYVVFSPLLAEYIKSHLRLRLPVKEAKLFRLLKEREGRVLTKDEIFEVLWQESEDASDWALNALIYRLRKNPTFAASGYVIESQKKVGYSLVKA